MPTVILQPGTEPRRLGAQESGQGRFGANPTRREQVDSPRRAAPPLPESSSLQSSTPTGVQALLSAEVGPGRTGRLGDMPGRLAGQARVGRTAAAPLPARDYLPAPAAYLVSSLMKLRRPVCSIS
ncbi:unnamed protein product [Rangifer tarandus platyrhynchus]|uniref:Uncharacterized protein n=1 Tax=Rangifer tarandus platyrhynchus TaxID=3082113 RepID=A0ABN8Z7G2_RANTA|nr:unnamed protein product [Rangifer tarandus platyrhynchus]